MKSRTKVIPVRGGEVRITTISSTMLPDHAVRISKELNNQVEKILQKTNEVLKEIADPTGQLYVEIGSSMHHMSRKKLERMVNELHKLLNP